MEGNDEGYEAAASAVAAPLLSAEQPTPAAVAVGDSTNPASAAPTPAPAGAAGYIKCSLCNNIIDSDEAAHLTVEHGHLPHLHEMLHVPLAPPPPPGISDDAATLHAIGAFVAATSRSADRGPAAFAVMQKAQMQLQRLLDGVLDTHGSVYAFGSVVSMGCWDGVGDGDFAFIVPSWFHAAAAVTSVVVEEDEDEDEDEEGEGEESETSASQVPVMDDTDDNSNGPVSPETGVDGEGSAPHVTPEPRWETDEMAAAIDALSPASPNDLHGQVISSEREKRAIRSVTSRLRDAGFRFEELDPVLHTRIPVVRRKRPTHDPLNLRAMQHDHLIRIRFDRPDAEAQFRRGRLPMLLETYNAREVTAPADTRRGGQHLVLAVPDSCDAVHLMARRERNSGVRKEWVAFKRTPEIFAIDFDLSCRYHGIRNSWLLRRYLEQDEVFRMGNVFLKRWSKACGINNSRVGFLTSYAVSVLWVYFLLRRGAVTFVDPASVPLLPDAATQSEVPYIPLWPPLAAAEAAAARTTRLGGLLRDFFYFYGDEFDWATQVVTIRQPCPDAAAVRTKADLNWLTDDAASLLLRDRCYHIFSIEDVYEDDLDLGRHLTADKAAWTRLQFRLAYTRCGAGIQQLRRLLDVPHKRAGEVLRARLFHHLLCDTDDACCAVADLVDPLCAADPAFPDEDPAYLLAAFELGNRLSDLWYDEEQIGLDIANHRRYDRRANLFTPPVEPMKHGEWGLVCADALPEDVIGAAKEKGRDKDDGSELWAAMAERVVRLEPPVAAMQGRHGHDRGGAPQGAPKRQRTLHLTKARNQLADLARTFAATPAKEGQVPAAVVGLAVTREARESVYLHCFFALQLHRFFPTYDARDTFAQCLEDVAWEVARLREAAEAAAAATLADRVRLFQHLQTHFAAVAAVLPGYADALRHVVLSGCDYLQFEKEGEATMLVPSPLLLHVVGAADTTSAAPPPGAAAPAPPGHASKFGSKGGKFGSTAAPARPRHADPAAKHAQQHPPQMHQGKKEKQHEGGESQGGKSAPPTAAATASDAGPLKMNPAKRKTGVCGQCGKKQIEVFPTSNPSQDSGYYCAKCWSSY